MQENYFRLFVLEDSSFFQSSIGAFFLDGFDGFGGEGESERFVEFGDENFLFMQIGKLSCITARIELGSAGPV